MIELGNLMLWLLKSLSIGIVRTWHDMIPMKKLKWKVTVKRESVWELERCRRCRNKPWTSDGFPGPIQRAVSPCNWKLSCAQQVTDFATSLLNGEYLFFSTICHYYHSKSIQLIPSFFSLYNYKNFTLAYILKNISSLF